MKKAYVRKYWILIYESEDDPGPYIYLDREEAMQAFDGSEHAEAELHEMYTQRAVKLTYGVQTKRLK